MSIADALAFSGHQGLPEFGAAGQSAPPRRFENDPLRLLPAGVGYGRKTRWSVCAILGHSTAGRYGGPVTVLAVSRYCRWQGLKRTVQMGWCRYLVSDFNTTTTRGAGRNRAGHHLRSRIPFRDRCSWRYAQERRLRGGRCPDSLSHGVVRNGLRGGGR